jgi:ribosome biogenesis SPOUT family RNA methylase Rps3
VREQSATRQQLEASIRALLPSQADIDELTPSKNSAASIAGVGGIMTGYVWGRYRGRQVRKRRES